MQSSNCGHPPAYVVDLDGQLEELTGHEHPALGLGAKDPSFETSDRRLHSPAMAIQQAVTDCWREPLQDDGTVVVMAVA